MNSLQETVTGEEVRNLLLLTFSVASVTPW